MDTIKAVVRIEAFEFYVQRALDLHLEENKQKVLALIKEQIDSIDWHKIIEAQIHGELNRQAHNIVKNAFSMDWTLEKDLRKQVQMLISAKMKDEIGVNET